MWKRSGGVAVIVIHNLFSEWRGSMRGEGGWSGGLKI